MIRSWRLKWRVCELKLFWLIFESWGLFCQFSLIKIEVQIKFVWKHELQFKNEVYLETWITILNENCLETWIAIHVFSFFYTFSHCIYNKLGISFCISFYLQILPLHLNQFKLISYNSKIYLKKSIFIYWSLLILYKYY